MALFLTLLFLFTTQAHSISSQPCEASFNKMEVLKKYPVLKDLEKEVKKAKKGKHEIIFTKDGPIFKVGFLRREDRRLLILLYKAIEEGVITKVDAGKVIGAKVLPLINAFRSRAKANKLTLEISGTFDQGKIFNAYYSKMSIPDYKVKGSLADFWSAQEVKDYETALKELNFSECRKNLNQEGLCQFSINIKGNKYKIEYSKLN